MRQSPDVFTLAQELEGEKALMNENIKHLEGLRDNMELNISDKEGGQVCILSRGTIRVSSLFLCLLSCYSCVHSIRNSACYYITVYQPVVWIRIRIKFKGRILIRIKELSWIPYGSDSVCG